MYPDGRMDILTRGQRRFEIVSLNEEKEYLQAEVSFFDDEDSGRTGAGTARPGAHELSDPGAACRGARTRPEPDLSDRQLSFQLAHHFPDLDFLSALLRHRSETERLKQLNQYLALYIPRQRAVERMKGLTPTNGHGGKPAGL